MTQDYLVPLDDNAHMAHLQELVRRRLKDKDVLDSDEDVLHDFKIDVFDVLGDFVTAALCSIDAGNYQTKDLGDVANRAVILGELTLRRSFSRAMTLAEVAIRTAREEGRP